MAVLAVGARGDLQALGASDSGLLLGEGEWEQGMRRAALVC